MTCIAIGGFFAILIVTCYLACLPPEVSEPNKDGAHYLSGEDFYNFSPFHKDPIDEVKEIIDKESKI